MAELARCNGTILIEDGDSLGVVERGGGWLGTAIFVAVLLTVIPGVAGAVLLVAVNGAAGLVVLAIGVLGGIAAVALIKRKRRQAVAPLPAPWLVFDLAGRVVRDAEGRALGSFNELRLERVFQAGSSSKALALHGKRKTVIARGTPFGDEVDAIEQELRRRGIGG